MIELMDTNSTRSKKFFRILPKIELHRHLEGSLRLSTMLEIAQSFDLDLPYSDPPFLRQLVQVLPGEPYTYRNFLSKFKTLRLFYRTPEIIHRITQEAIGDAAEDNVRHLEMRFTPVALGVIRQIPAEEIIDIVVTAAEEARKKHQISTSLIVSMNRHESLHLAEKVVRAAVDRRNDGIAGLDLAGDEANFPAAPFADLLGNARKDGLLLTIHAGEWGGAENVVEALQLFKADRIGHGVRVMEDADAVLLAAESGATFEVCPTSNLQSGVCSNLSTHPMKRMMDAGIKVTLNTDDPGVSAIKLTHEYVNAHNVMQLTVGDLRKATLDAAQNAFLNGSDRRHLVNNIGKEFDQKIKILENEEVI